MTLLPHDEKREHDGKKEPVYDITVRISVDESEVWRTKRLLNDDNAATLLGRGTRIWEVNRVVREIVDLNQSGVLKDSWVDVDRLREGQVIEELRASTTLSQAQKASLEPFFLTTLAKGDVYIGTRPDTTRDLMTNGKEPPQQSRFTLFVSDSQPQRTNSKLPTNTTPSAAAKDPVNPSEIVVYGPKIRHRIVFKEKCTPLSDVTSLKSAYQHLAQTVVGECILYLCNFVILTNACSATAGTCRWLGASRHQYWEHSYCQDRSDEVG